MNYLRSTDGDNGDNGSTWALANATLSGAITDSSTGDTTFAADGHSESQGTALTLTLPGTVANPYKLICVDDTGDPEPPTAPAVGATIATSGSALMNVNGSAYIYGMIFNSAGNTNLNNAAADSVQVYENCDIRTTNIGSTGRFQIGSSNNFSYVTTLRNCRMFFNNSAQQIQAFGRLIFEGGSIISGSAVPTSFLRLPTDRSSGNIFIRGFDFTNLGTSFNIFDAAAGNSGRGVVSNSKFATGWAGNLVSGAVDPGQRYELYNSDLGATYRRFWIEDYSGTIFDDTATYLTGGSTDRGVAFSMFMASGASCAFPSSTLQSHEIGINGLAVGSPITLNARFTTGSTLTDKDISLSVEFYGTDGSHLSTIASNRAGVLDTAANHSTDGVSSWVNGDAVNQVMDLTFTPEEEGVYVVRVSLTKPSTAVNVDIKFT